MSRDSKPRFVSVSPISFHDPGIDREAFSVTAHLSALSSGQSKANRRHAKSAKTSAAPRLPAGGSAADPIASAVPRQNFRTVCVVEALTAIRQLTVNYVQHLGEFKVVNASGSFDEGLKACATLRPDIAIVDGCMSSETHGTSLCRAIQSASPTTKVVVFSPSAHPDLIREAVDANVAGFVLRTDSAATVASALREVATGNSYLCREAAAVVREHSQIKAESTILLSARERQVLKEIARGRLSKEIATALGMSVFGVQNVRRRITRKTGLKSVAQLTLYAAKVQLVPGPSER